MVTKKKSLNKSLEEKKKFQFVCDLCGEGFNQRSQIERHKESSHPQPAPSAADLGKTIVWN